MTRQVTDQLYIEIDYFTPEEYFVYTAEAQIAQASEATMSVTAGVIKASAEANITATFTQTATISHLEGADLFAFSEAALAAAVDRIRDNNVAVSSVFDIATDATRFRQIDSSEDAQFDISAIVERSRATSMETQAAFSIIADGDVIGQAIEGTATLTSEITLSATVERTQQGSASLASEFSQTTIVERIQQGSADLSSEFTQTASVERIQQGASSIASEFTVSAIISHIEGADIVANNFADLSTNIDVVRDALANIESTTELTSTATRIQEDTVSANFAAELTAELVGIIEVSAQLSTETSQTVEYNVTKDNVVVAESNFAQIVSEERIRGFDSAVSTTSELTCVISHIEGADIVLSNFAAMNITAVKSVEVASTQTSSAILTASAIKIKQFNSAVSAVSSLSITGIEIPYAVAWSSSNLFINQGNLRVNTSTNTNFATITYPRSATILSDTTWTVEFRMGQGGGDLPGSGVRRSIFSTRDSKLRLNIVGSSSTDFALELIAVNDSNQTVSSTSVTISNTSRQYAIVRNGSALYVFAGADRVINLTISGSFTSSNDYFYLGASTFHNSHICSFSFLRISNTARYANNTTRTEPSEPLRKDLNTLGMYQLDETISTDFLTFASPGDRGIVESGAINLSSTVTLFAIVGEIEQINITAFANSSIVVSIDKLKEAESFLGSEASIEASIDKISDALSTQNSEFTQSLDYERIRDSNIATESIATQLTAVAKVGDFLVTLESEFQQFTDVNLNASAASSVVSEFTSSANSIKAVEAESSTSGEFSQSVSSDRIRDNASTQSSEFNSNVSAAYITENTVSASANFTLVADSTGGTFVSAALLMSSGTMSISGDRIRDNTTVSQSETELSAVTNNSRTRLVDSVQSSEFNQSTVFDRFRSSSIQTESIASELVVGDKFSDVVVSMSSEFTVSAIGSRTRGLQSDTNAKFDLQASAVRTFPVEATATSDTTLTAIGFIGSEASAAMYAETTLAALAVKNSEIILVAFTDAALGIAVDRIRLASSDSSADSNVSADLGRIRTTGADITAMASELTAAGKLVASFANLQATFSLTAAVRVIHTDDNVYIIQPESRSFKVSPESRLYKIQGESRIFTIIN